jgi:hypothetical protein
MKMAVNTSKQRNSAARSGPQRPRTLTGSEFRHHAQASASSKASATRAIRGADLPPPTGPRQLNRGGRSRRSELRERTYRSWPAVSQIWALTTLPSTWRERVANSTPMVDLDSRLNSLRVKRESRLDLPTPESPMSTTLKR